MFVCCCLGVTDREIHAEIDAGACSVEAVSACTGAGSRCGTCRLEIAAMIETRQASGAPARRADGHLHLEVLPPELDAIAAE